MNDADYQIILRDIKKSKQVYVNKSCYHQPIAEGRLRSNKSIVTNLKFTVDVMILRSREFVKTPKFHVKKRYAYEIWIVEDLALLIFENALKVIDDTNMVRPGCYSVMGCQQIWKTAINLNSYSAAIVKSCDFDVHQSIKLHSKTNSLNNISQGLSKHH